MCASHAGADGLAGADDGLTGANGYAGAGADFPLVCASPRWNDFVAVVGGPASDAGRVGSGLLTAVPRMHFEFFALMKLTGV